MTKERLEGYRSCKEEINELRYRIECVKNDDNMIGNDTIFDYRTGYPRPQAVVGYDYEKDARLTARYLSRIDKLKTECTEVEEWIEAISDSLTRRIFRMYYIYGVRQSVIAQRVHLSQSKVSEKISGFLKSG